MKVARGVLTKKLLSVVILSSIIALIIVFLAPSNLGIIFLLIFFISLLLSLISKFFVAKKYVIAIGLTSFILLTLKALGLFDIINILLTISFIIGVLILIK